MSITVAREQYEGGTGCRKADSAATGPWLVAAHNWCVVGCQLWKKQTWLRWWILFRCVLILYTYRGKKSIKLISSDI